MAVDVYCLFEAGCAVIKGALHILEVKARRLSVAKNRLSCLANP
jgi:hypothetical protein